MVSAPAWRRRTAASYCPAGAPRAAPASLSESRPPVDAHGLVPADEARSQDFGRARRLLSPADYTRVFRAGRRRSDACFTMIAAPGPGPAARLGLTISRKVSKSAVQRNRIKRLVRECFRRHGVRGMALDIVVMARPGAAACDNAELTRRIDELLERTARQCEASRSC